MTNYQRFVALHNQEDPLLLGNVWDVSRAKSLVAAGYSSLGASSAAMAHLLGYEGGEEMRFEELLLLVKRIKQNVIIPLSMDVEAGYAKDISKVVGNVLRLEDLTIAGINIEDSIVTYHLRGLIDKGHLSSIIAAIRLGLESKEKELFINARIDTYLLGVPNKLQETLSRVQFYEQAGASGIFIPLLKSSADITQIVKSTRLPTSLMDVPGLPFFDQLQKLDVKTISTGNFLHQKLNTELTRSSTFFLRCKEFETLLQW